MKRNETQVGGTAGLTNAGFPTLAGSSQKSISGAVVNQGTMTQTGTGILNLGSGTLTNQAGGLYDLQSDAGMTSSGTFVNQGTFPIPL